MNKHVPNPQIDAGDMKPYVDCGYDLIPLHRADAVSTWNGKQRKDGKRPLHSNWTKRAYDPAKVVEECAASRNNVGVRLTGEQLVVDVDPRNGGEDGFTSLCADLKMDPSAWPHVVTGSSGSHYYLRKPADAPVLDTVPDYPGVEFKSRGRQVVAAGSVHPDTLRRYEWSFDSASLSEAPEAPSALLELIRRPQTTGATGGGEHTQEEIASMLDALEPSDFREHDRWLALMMACHHATSGDARVEFIEWSARDPEYADRESENGRRWDSLHKERDDAITYKTLHKFLRDADREDAIPRSSPEEDFADELTEEELAGIGSSGGNPVDAIVGRMNEKFCAVLDGGGFKVFREDIDDAYDPPRRVFDRLSRETFLHYHEDERVRLPDVRRDTTVAELWLRHPRRRKYAGIVMDPDGRSSGKLNLWRGWAVEPSPGDWSLMRGLIRDVLCGGVAEHGDYVERWIAHMLQHPGTPPEVAIAFRGEEGTGKGTLGRALMRIAGTHGLTVSSPGQFAGRFNAHLRDCIFLFADEAFWPGDKEAEGVLKQLVTEPVISYEGKGKDITQGRNMVHVMMASNKDWIVPAGVKARRFAVFDATEDHRQDREFFGRLKQQLDDRGLAGMVHDLLSMDLGGWHPADDVPQTNALADQKERTLEPAMQFWLMLLDADSLPHYVQHLAISMADWDWRLSSSNEVWFGEDDKARIVEAYREFLREHRIGYLQATHRAVFDAGKKAFGMRSIQRRSSGKQERVWVLPPLAEARRRFEAALGFTGRFDR